MAVGTTFSSLIQRVAQRTETYDTFTVNGGSTTTAIANGFWKGNNQYVGQWLYVATTNGSVAPFGEERQIKSSAQSTLTATLSYALSASIAAGQTIELYSRWSHAAIGRAVNNAIRTCSGYWWRAVVDESLTVNGGTYSYSLAALTVPVEERYKLHRVSVKYSDTYATFPYQEIRDYELRFSGANATLQFSRQYPIGKTLRLEYIASPSTMTNATDTTGVDSSTWIDDYLVEYTLFELYQGRAGFAPSTDKSTDMALAQQHRDEAERLRRMHSMRPPAKRVHIRASSMGDTDDSKMIGAFSVPGPT